MCVFECAIYNIARGVWREIASLPDLVSVVRSANYGVSFTIDEWVRSSSVEKVPPKPLALSL